MGKTSVAVHAARNLMSRYADGVFFVDLASVHDEELVAHSLATALGITVTADDPFAALVAAMRDSRVLLLLDSCEHVIGAVAVLAETLLLRLPLLHILSTSREPLRIRGEWVQHLASLGIPPETDGAPLRANEAIAWPAVRLFVERCDATLGGFTLSDADAPLVASICRRLDGIPLAIELAASRIHDLGLLSLANLLEDRLKPLTQGFRNAPPRHQTLRTTLDWSHNLLDEGTQRVLRRISIFRGSFSLASAAAICDCDVDQNIGDLVTKSLLTADHMHAPLHFRLFETTRSYGMDKLAADDDLASVQRLHAQDAVRLSTEMQKDWSCVPARQWTAIYGRRIDDIRAAIEWSFSEQGLNSIGIQLTIASANLFHQLSLLDEYRSRVERALNVIAASEPTDQTSEFHLYCSLANLLRHTDGLSPRMEAAYERANELAKSLDVAAHRARALGGMWVLKIVQADFKSAGDWAQRFGELHESIAGLGPVYERMQAVNMHFMGQPASVETLDRHVLAEGAVASEYSPAAPQADRRLFMQIYLSRSLWIQGYADRALAMAHEAVNRAREDNAVSLCMTLAFAACPIAMWCGDAAQSHAWVSDLRECAQRHSLKYWDAWALGYERALVSTGSLEYGERAEAVPLWPLQLDTMQTVDSELIDDQTVMRARNGEAPWSTAEVLRRFGERLLLKGRGPDSIREAEALFREAMTVARNQAALAWELRAALSLAKLLAAKDSAREAKEVLSGVLLRFSEGHETQDFRMAMALETQLDHKDAVT